MNIKEYFSNKKYGFYVTLAAILLTVVTLIIYASVYGSTVFMAPATIAFLAIGIVGSIVLIVFKLYRFAPAVLLGASVLGLCFSIYYLYNYIASAVYGIQFAGFPPEFFANIVFFVLTIVVSIAANFMPQEKKD